MTEQDIIHKIREGYSDAHIKSIFKKESEQFNTFVRRKYYPSYNTTDNPATKRCLLHLLEKAGFTVRQELDSLLPTRHSELWSAAGEGFSALLKWDEIVIPGNHYTYCLTITAPDSSEWILTYAFGVNTDIAAFVRLWRAWYEQSLSIDRCIGKLRKKFNIGVSTINAVVRNIADNSDLTYNIERKRPDTTLRVRLRNHRCLVMHMQPHEDMASLATITNMIDVVRDALDKAGAVNLTVKADEGDIEWHRAESINTQQ